MGEQRDYDEARALAEKHCWLLASKNRKATAIHAEAIAAALRAAEERGRDAAVRAIEAVPVEELAMVLLSVTDDRPWSDVSAYTRYYVSGEAEAVRQRLLAAVRGPAQVVGDVRGNLVRWLRAEAMHNHDADMQACLTFVADSIERRDDEPIGDSARKDDGHGG